MGTVRKELIGSSFDENYQFEAGQYHAVSSRPRTKPPELLNERPRNDPALPYAVSTWLAVADLDLTSADPTSSPPQSGLSYRCRAPWRGQSRGE